MNRENFELRCGEIVIRGTLCLPSGSKELREAWVLLCHGIPGGTKSPEDPGYLELAKNLCTAGYRSVVFNFRGAGESTGDFDLHGWAEDLKRVMDYVETVSPELPSIVLFGFSAGAAVSVYAASHDPRVVGLILAAGPADFNSILVEEGAAQFLEHARSIGIIRDPAFPYDPAAWINAFRIIDPETWISKIKNTPLLILHGDHDETVPVNQGYRVYEKAPEPKELIIIKGAGHRLRLNEEAMKAALNWLQRSIR